MTSFRFYSTCLIFMYSVCTQRTNGGKHWASWGMSIPLCLFFVCVCDKATNSNWKDFVKKCRWWRWKVKQNNLFMTLPKSTWTDFILFQVCAVARLHSIWFCWLGVYFDELKMTNTFSVKIRRGTAISWSSFVRYKHLTEENSILY